MRIIWLLSSSVSFRSYVMSVVVCTCVCSVTCSCLKVRQSSILTAFSDRPKWRIGPAHGGIVPATSTATWRPISAVFPLFSRCVPAGSTTIKRQEEPRGIGRKSVCVCHVKLMHHHHVSGRCVPVSKCVSRAFSDRLPSKPSKHGGSASLQKRVLCPRTFSLHHQTARICADSSTGVYPFLTHSPPLLTDVAESMTSMHRSGTDTQDGEGVARPPGRMTLSKVMLVRSGPKTYHEVRPDHNDHITTHKHDNLTAHCAQPLGPVTQHNCCTTGASCVNVRVWASTLTAHRARWCSTNSA